MDTLCAGSRRFNAFRKERICPECSKMNYSRVMWSANAQFRGLPGVLSYVNNRWWLVKIGHWIEHACTIKSETINLDRRLDLRCNWISFQREEILSCILQVSLQYTSRVSGYNTSTGYGLDSLSIPRWLEKYCAGSVSGKSQGWYWFSCAIHCEIFIIDNSDSIPNSFTILLSGALELDQ
jgi:hypothetical protein